MRRRLLVLLLAAALPTAAAAPAAATASAWATHKGVRARLVAGRLGPAGELRLGLHLALEPGWHAYWRHPGDAGLPPDVELTAEPAITAARLLFPAPRRMPQPGDLVALGYEGEVVYPLRARPRGGAPRRVTAAADYLVCASECIPYRDRLTVELPAGGAPADAEDALLAVWERRLPRKLGEVPGLAGRSGWQRTRKGGALVLELRGAGASPGEAAELFLEPPPALACTPPVRELLPDGVRFRATCEALEALPSALALPWTASGLGAATAPLAVEGVARLTTGGAPGG